MKQFCTVVTRSHLHYVASLSDSLQSSGNTEPLFVLVADSGPAGVPPDSDLVRYIPYERVADQLPPMLRYYYDPFELSNALKPYLITLLFDQCGADRVIYLDSDLLVTGSFAAVWDGFGSASVQVSLHQFTPPPLGFKVISEVHVTDMGFINGGFAAWRDSPEARLMLDWMRTRFVVYGFCDRRHGMFVDQKLMPLLLQYFPADVAVLRHPGINVAFWNAYEREVHRSADGRWKIGDADVIFFHLSGYRLTSPGVPCTYLEAGTNALILSKSPWMSAVLAQYHEVLARHRADGPPAPYAFASYRGVTLTQEYRRLIFRTGGLDRGTYAFWRIWVREHLRLLKRLLVRLVPRS
jgi:hypothetical protein